MYPNDGHVIRGDAGEGIPPATVTRHAEAVAAYGGLDPNQACVLCRLALTSGEWKRLGVADPFGPSPDPG